MNGVKYYYIAERGNEKVIGTINDMAHLLGKRADYIHHLIEYQFRTREGWTVKKYRRGVYIYIAEHPEEDPIIGTSEEVACLLSFTEEYIRKMARTGKKSKNGWTIRRKYKIEKQD